eukprot:jgi/Botrbrau1/9084/Bobra.178_2s0016.1
MGPWWSLVFMNPCKSPYPYPYERHHWFNLLQSDAQRKPPSWIHTLVSAAQPDKVPTLQQIYARSSFLLGGELITNGQAHAGNLARLRLTLVKLISGAKEDCRPTNQCATIVWLPGGLNLGMVGSARQPISVVALGGSITNGGETFVTRMEDSFVGRLFSWLNSTFPHAEHRFLNAGTSASESSFFSACLSDHLLHNNADLVFLEFDINDCSPQYKGG